MLNDRCCINTVSSPIGYMVGYSSPSESIANSSQLSLYAELSPLSEANSNTETQCSTCDYTSNNNNGQDNNNNNIITTNHIPDAEHDKENCPEVFCRSTNNGAKEIHSSLKPSGVSKGDITIRNSDKTDDISDDSDIKLFERLRRSDQFNINKSNKSSAGASLFKASCRENKVNSRIDRLYADFQRREANRKKKQLDSEKMRMEEEVAECTFKPNVKNDNFNNSKTNSCDGKRRSGSSNSRSISHSKESHVIDHSTSNRTDISDVFTRLAKPYKAALAKLQLDYLELYDEHIGGQEGRERPPFQPEINHNYDELLEVWKGDTHACERLYGDAKCRRERKEVFIRARSTEVDFFSSRNDRRTREAVQSRPNSGRGSNLSSFNERNAAICMSNISCNIPMLKDRAVAAIAVMGNANIGGAGDSHIIANKRLKGPNAVDNGDTSTSSRGIRITRSSSIIHRSVVHDTNNQIYTDRSVRDDSSNEVSVKNHSHAGHRDTLETPPLNSLRTDDTSITVSGKNNRINSNVISASLDNFLFGATSSTFGTRDGCGEYGVHCSPSPLQPPDSPLCTRHSTTRVDGVTHSKVRDINIRPFISPSLSLSPISNLEQTQCCISNISDASHQPPHTREGIDSSVADILPSKISIHKSKSSSSGVEMNDEEASTASNASITGSSAKQQIYNIEVDRQSKQWSNGDVKKEDISISINNKGLPRISIEDLSDIIDNCVGSLSSDETEPPPPDLPRHTGIYSDDISHIHIHGVVNQTPRSSDHESNHNSSTTYNGHDISSDTAGALNHKGMESVAINSIMKNEHNIDRIPEGDDHVSVINGIPSAVKVLHDHTSTEATCNIALNNNNNNNNVRVKRDSTRLEKLDDECTFKPTINIRRYKKESELNNDQYPKTTKSSTLNTMHQLRLKEMLDRTVDSGAHTEDRIAAQKAIRSETNTLILKCGRRAPFTELSFNQRQELLDRELMIKKRNIARAIALEENGLIDTNGKKYRRFIEKSLYIDDIGEYPVKLSNPPTCTTLPHHYDSDDPQHPVNRLYRSGSNSEDSCARVKQLQHEQKTAVCYRRKEFQSNLRKHVQKYYDKQNVKHYSSGRGTDVVDDKDHPCENNGSDTHNHRWRNNGDYLSDTTTNIPGRHSEYRHMIKKAHRPIAAPILTPADNDDMIQCTFEPTINKNNKYLKSRRNSGRRNRCSDEGVSHINLPSDGSDGFVSYILPTVDLQLEGSPTPISLQSDSTSPNNSNVVVHSTTASENDNEIKLVNAPLETNDKNIKALISPSISSKDTDSHWIRESSSSCVDNNNNCNNNNYRSERVLLPPPSPSPQSHRLHPPTPSIHSASYVNSPCMIFSSYPIKLSEINREDSQPHYVHDDHEDAFLLAQGSNNSDNSPEPRIPQSTAMDFMRRFTAGIGQPYLCKDASLPSPEALQTSRHGPSDPLLPPASELSSVSSLTSRSCQSHATDEYCAEHMYENKRGVGEEQWVSTMGSSRVIVTKQEEGNSDSDTVVSKELSNGCMHDAGLQHQLEASSDHDTNDTNDTNDQLDYHKKDHKRRQQPAGGPNIKAMPLELSEGQHNIRQQPAREEDMKCHFQRTSKDTSMGNPSTSVVSSNHINVRSQSSHKPDGTCHVPRVNKEGTTGHRPVLTSILSPFPGLESHCSYTSVHKARVALEVEQEFKDKFTFHPCVAPKTQRIADAAREGRRV